MSADLLYVSKRSPLHTGCLRASVPAGVSQCLHCMIFTEVGQEHSECMISSQILVEQLAQGQGCIDLDLLCLKASCVLQVQGSGMPCRASGRGWT